MDEMFSENCVFKLWYRHDESHPHAVRVAEAYVGNLAPAAEDEGTWRDHAKELQHTTSVSIMLDTNSFTKQLSLLFYNYNTAYTISSQINAQLQGLWCWFLIKQT